MDFIVWCLWEWHRYFQSTWQDFSCRFKLLDMWIEENTNSTKNFKLIPEVHIPLLWTIILIMFVEQTLIHLNIHHAHHQILSVYCCTNITVFESIFLFSKYHRSLLLNNKLYSNATKFISKKNQQVITLLIPRNHQKMLNGALVKIYRNYFFHKNIVVSFFFYSLNLFQ